VKSIQKAPGVAHGIHLNIGCGNKLWPGFVNIDFPGNWSGKEPDIECDVRKLELPDDYADSAYAIHVLEHFYRWETEDVLTEWKRVLKPGGKLIVELPCLDRVLAFFINALETKTPINYQATMWRLYGDPIYKDEHMVHRWCFLVSELRQIFESVGFKDIEVKDPEYHHPRADMRMVGTK
jgi:predicted SAM-dependent methyltransferase